MQRVPQYDGAYMYVKLSSWKSYATLRLSWKTALLIKKTCTLKKPENFKIKVLDGCKNSGRQISWTNTFYRKVMKTADLFPRFLVQAVNFEIIRTQINEVWKTTYYDTSFYKIWNKSFLRFSTMCCMRVNFSNYSDLSSNGVYSHANLSAQV